MTNNTSKIFGSLGRLSSREYQRKDSNSRSYEKQNSEKSTKSIQNLFSIQKRQVSVNESDIEQVFISAAKKGQYQLIKQAIQQEHVEVNYVNYEGVTALYVAAENGHLDICKYLLEYFADIHFKYDNVQSVLYVAAQNGHHKVCRYLVEHGAGVNELNGHETALYAAVLKGHYEVCIQLIGLGADLKFEKYGGYTLLCAAAQEGHYDICKLLVKKGLDVNHIAEDKNSVLTIAVQNAHDVDVCQVLIENGADVNYQCGEYVEPALYTSSKHALFEITELLVKNNADVNCRFQEMSPLYIAAQKNHIRTVQYLIQNNADVSYCKTQFWSVLAISALEQRMYISKLLIEKGACLKPDMDYQYAFAFLQVAQLNQKITEQMIEARGGFHNIKIDGWLISWFAADRGLDYLAQLPGKNGMLFSIEFGKYKKQFKQSSIFHSSCQRGQQNLCRFFIELGTDVNDSRGSNQSALQIATQNGHHKICQILIDNGADVNQEDSEGVSILDLAAQNGHFEICTLLIDKGAQYEPKQLLQQAVVHGHTDLCDYLVNRMNNLNGYDPSILFDAASEGMEDIVRLLINKGANVNLRDENSNTLLHNAVKKGNLRMCKLLCQKGALIDEVNAMGQTPLCLAATSEKDIGIARLLVDFGADYNFKFMGTQPIVYFAVSQKNYALCELLIEELKVDVNQNINGFTLLYIAAYNGELKLCMLMLENAQADVNFTNPQGTSVLGAAAYQGHSWVCDFLILKGAHVNHVNNLGCSPLYLAAQQGHLRTCKILLQYNADVNCCNSKGMSVLQMAVQKGSAEVCRLLINHGADTQHINGDGESVMQLAVQNRHEQIIKMIDPSTTLDQQLDLIFQQERLENRMKQVEIGQQEKTENDNMCIICTVNKATFAAVHGKEAHVCLCNECVRRFEDKLDEETKCPMCMQPVSSIVRLFF